MTKKIKRLNANPGYVQYLRTSSEEAQAPERSQDAQRRDIDQRLLRHQAFPDLGEYVDNFTGTSADRKHYQRMLTDARLGKFSHVFAATPDRFGRDDVEALRAIDEMTKLGITVRFASHPDLDPADADDRLYLNILFGMAKRESAVTARRVCGGMISKLLGGGWTWRAPDGYINKEIRLNQLGPEEQLKHAQYKRWIEIDPEQSKVWRYAWDLLLTDRYSLEEICEKLHERGFRSRNGKAFIEIKRSKRQPEGIRIPYIQILSYTFHNWFYAGWVVLNTSWKTIQPKTVRGEWEAIVTTEEFERGLAILAQRNHKPMPEKKHLYLLQGIIYLRDTDDTLRKLTCSRPNANRKRGGVSYYCISSSSQNFLCHVVDSQMLTQLQAIQVDADLLPQIRKTYLSDVTRYTSDQIQERKALESRKRKLDEKEVNMWRAFTDHGMRPQVYESLAKEYQEERERIESLIQQIEVERTDYVADLDAALRIVSEIGERFAKCAPQQQRAILLQMVERVVINAAGKIQFVEWKTPFCYLSSLKHSTTGGTSKTQKAKKARTSGKSAGSLPIKVGGPSRIRTCNHAVMSRVL